MKILLLKCGSGLKKGVISDFNSQTIYPPLGLLYIAAVLENDGHQVEIFDLFMEDLSSEQFTKTIASADAVGISVYMDNYRDVATISKIIKETEPTIPIILGGPHCIITKHRALNDIPQADISVISEGEQTVIEIVKYIQGKQKLSDIHGILYKEKNTIKTGKPLRIIKDLDTLPVPARHLVEKYDYGNFPWGFKYRKKFTSIITSRGCPFSCRFCARYGNTIQGYAYRQRSAENVVKEIQEIDQRYNSIMFVDDNFLADIRRAHKIFDMLLETGIDSDLMIMGARVDATNKELYTKMKKAGVKLIGYGIESGNQDVLDYYNKKITLQQIRNAVNLARKSGFKTFGTFIFGAPIETTKHIENTIKFAHSLKLDVALFGVLFYAMGSDLWKEAVQNDVISKDEYIVVANSQRNLGNFTLEELYTYSRKANRSYYLRPTYIATQLSRAILNGDINVLLNGMKFITDLKKKNVDRFTS